VFNRLRNLDDLSTDEMVLLEEALTQEIIRCDRSTLIGDIRRNRMRLALRVRLGTARLRRLARLQGAPPQALDSLTFSE
jgi:hypothetical protein